MKKLSLLMMVLMVSLLSMAQVSNYETEMFKTLEQFRQKEVKVDFLKLSDAFNLIAISNPKKHEVKYYEALCLVFNSFKEKDNKLKDIQLDKANLIIDKAIGLEVSDAELYILKALLFQMKINIDPRKRGYEYSQKAEKQLSKAFELDDNNPRYYFLKGQNVFFTPKQYGGGKEKAKPYFEKAKELFTKEKPESVLSPIWGRDTNLAQLKACK